MEGKRAAAATLYCMLIMLSGQHQQQVAGFTGFRFHGCFCDCCHGCREGQGHPAWFCTVKCVETCAVVISDEVHDAAFHVADCSKVCFTTSICGVAQITGGTIDAGAAAACVDDCTQNWNPYKKNKHTRYK